MGEAYWGRERVNTLDGWCTFGMRGTMQKPKEGGGGGGMAIGDISNKKLRGIHAKRRKNRIYHFNPQEKRTTYTYPGSAVGRTNAWGPEIRVEADKK